MTYLQIVAKTNLMAKTKMLAQFQLFSIIAISFLNQIDEQVPIYGQSPLSGPVFDRLKIPLRDECILISKVSASIKIFQKFII